MLYFVFSFFIFCIYFFVFHILYFCVGRSGWRELTRIWAPNFVFYISDFVFRTLCMLYFVFCILYFLICYFKFFCVVRSGGSWPAFSLPHISHCPVATTRLHVSTLLLCEVFCIFCFWYFVFFRFLVFCIFFCFVFYVLSMRPSVVWPYRPSACGAWIRYWRVHQGLNASGGLLHSVYRLKCFVSLEWILRTHGHTQITQRFRTDLSMFWSYK